MGVEKNKAEKEVGGTRTVTYNDGTTQTYKLMALSEIDFTINYSLIISEPAVSYSSQLNKIRLQRITTSDTPQTFVEWTSDFSNDADAQVIQDSRFKKQDGFKALAAALNA